MDINKFPELQKFLPIDIDKCKEYWDTKMNGHRMSSFESTDWFDCEKNLMMINNNNIPITARTYYFSVKIPFIIANFIAEGGANQKMKI